MASTLHASLLPLPRAMASCPSPTSPPPLSAPGAPSPAAHPTCYRRPARGTLAGAASTLAGVVPGSKAPTLARLAPQPWALPCWTGSLDGGAARRCQASGGKEGVPAGEGGEEGEGGREEEHKPLASFNPLPWPLDVAGMLPLSPSSSGQPFLLGGPHASAGLRSNASSSFSPLTQAQAQGIILRAAMGTGWTTTTGLEGPSLEPGFPSPLSTALSSSGAGTAAGAGAMLPFEGGGGGGAEEGERGNVEGKRSLSWPELTSSPRRTSRVKFTCNRCGERTTRAINPHAYGEGTVFVQCGGCLVFHKLVDNLNLFHELQGSVFLASDAGQRGFGVHESVDILGLEDPFPTMPFN